MNDTFRRWKSMSVLALFTLVASLITPAWATHPATAQAHSFTPRFVSALQASVAVDGVIDAAYGAPIATDPAGDGNANPNMDLGSLYVTEDADSFFVAFTVNGDIGAANWGKYMLYIDTTNDANGATSDAWGRNVVVNDPHKPEFSINSWVDAAPYGAEDTQLWSWTGSGWSQSGSVESAALSAGATSVIEWEISKAALNNPDTLWMEVWSTGGGDGDNAQDTINAPADDWNAADFSTLATLAVSTQYDSFYVAPVVDGALDDSYQLLATDPADTPQGNAATDLLALYAADDADHFYFALEVNADIATSNWAKYILAIDTVAGAGATTDAWGRNVQYAGDHLPDFSINSWVDAAPYGAEDTQFWTYTGSWNESGSVAEAALGTGTTSLIEWKVSKAALGNPDAVWLEAWTTGGGGSDNAQDTVPDDWTATDWSTQAVLDNFVQYTARVEGDTGPQPVCGTPGDGDIARSVIEHDSRDDLFRMPYGAVEQNTPVTLRLRTAQNDVENVRVRLYSTATSGQTIAEMTKVNSDPELCYDYWEYTMPGQADIGVVYYRFIIEDGATTVYYEDHTTHDGGLGEVLNSSADRSWNIYVYESGFTTPEWAKNAVIYQIFVERFRNGDESNDPTDDPSTDRGWFYPTERGHRFPVEPWNTIVPDPEPYSDPSNPWWATYSSTMYGGDLNGVIEKLDYIQSLGVTTLYLNPIFDSPSNHKYDGRSFRDVDPAFGDKAAYDQLVDELNNRGMYLILDAVPNHVSSDSPYFDRFERHPEVGACESVSSPYREWFFFEPADPAGTGVCAGDTNYRGWFGVATLPQINTANPEVLSFWFADQGSGNPNVPYTNTVNYWLDEGADGWRVDVVPDVVGVNPDFFEIWRDNIKAEHPDSMTYSETWSEGDVRDRVLGDEFDSTMNYRFRKAVLGFGRDTRWVDNDGGQEIDPLTPSGFVRAFQAIEEDYPEPVFLSAMNLLDSHDTNRIVHVLNEAGFTGSGYDREPVDGFADARDRVELVSALQMTLPGAPTVYYGDEVGLTGYGYDVPRDDPYNRQPYPWADEAGYDSLPDWRKAQLDLLDHYRNLTAVRNTPAFTFLRTGSFDPLYTNDEEGLLAFGRRDTNGAAIVVFNQSTSATKTVELDLSSYIPDATVLDQQLPVTTTVAPNASMIYEFEVGPRGFGIWTTPSTVDMSAPASTTLSVVSVSTTAAELSWLAQADATSYNVYRSYVSGGGYELITNTTSLSYTDTGLTIGTNYYYIVKTVRDGIESDASNEVVVLPGYDLTSAWYRLTGPSEITHTISTITATEMITGELYIAGGTEADGPAQGLMVELGYGPVGTDPTSPTAWMWVDAAYLGQAGNNDIYGAQLLPDMVGEYVYAFRFSSNRGATWFYGDLDGPGYSEANAGQLHVESSADTAPPATPINLREASRSAAAIAVEWDAVADNDLALYEVFRDGVMIGTVAAGTTIFTDTAVMINTTYTYTVRAVDTSFNRSQFSNSIDITAEQRDVTVTFRVRVPEETPDSSTVYIAGSDASVFGAQWSPNAQPMTEVSPNVWEWTTQVPEGTALEYKYTRGTWEKVEAWGTIVGFTNRRITIDFPASGTALVDNTATDWGTGDADHKAVQYWRDPLIDDVMPQDNAIITDTTGLSVTAVWTRPVSPTSTVTQVLTVEDASGTVITGTVTVISNTATWTPDSALATGVYTATAFNVKRADLGDPSNMQSPHVWNFRVVDPNAPYYGIAVQADTLALTGTAGTTVTYQLTITNTGNVTDSFEVDVSGTWANNSFTVDALAPGASTTVMIAVAIPDNASTGTSEAVTVTVSSTGDTSQMEQITLTTTVVEMEQEEWIIYLPIVRK